MKEVMHLILKYNDSIYNVETIKKHQNLIDSHGKVIWGVIKPNQNSPKISNSRIEIIKEQIANGVKTYAFMATKGGIVAQGEIKDILGTEEVLKNKNFVPKYYHSDLDRCIAGIFLQNIDNVKNDILNSLVRYGSEDDNVAVGNQTNPLYVSIKKKENKSKTEYDIPEKKRKLEKEDNKIKEDFLIDNVVNIEEKDMKDYIDIIQAHLLSKGFTFSTKSLSNFYLCLKTKPFVILAGISGTGKSKLVRLFAETIGATNKNNRFIMIPVKPDWNDSTELIGYKNINEEFIPGRLTEIIEIASREENQNKPYFVCLDEMNLARVEYYFSDVLSLMESRYRDEGSKKILTDHLFPKYYLNEDSKFKNLYIPDNLYFIGTVNMDDTTYSFSRKVLDRANTIEFSNVDFELKLFNYNNSNTLADLEKASNDFLKTEFLSIKDAIDEDFDYVNGINEKIIKINKILKQGNKHFGYRVRDEIIFYMLTNKNVSLLKEEEAFDFQILQKILTTITGSETVVKRILVGLYNFCNPQGQISEEINYVEEGQKNLNKALYKMSAEKIIDMLRGYDDGFTSYWI
jgi:MoxR-like ATPase